MSVEFVDTNTVIYSLGKDAIKRKKTLAVLARKPVLTLN